MSTTTIKPRVYLPWSHPGAERVMSEARSENWACMGRRWWKTSTLSKHFVRQLISKRRHRMVWGAPLWSQVWTAWGEMERMLQGSCKLYRGKDDVHIECPWTEATIRFRSLDNPDSARSLTADEVCIDEAADAPPDAWHKVLGPMLMSTQGTLWAVGTPKGMNWFWRQFQAARTRLEQDPTSPVATWQTPSIGARIEQGKLVRSPSPYENPTLSFEWLLQKFNDPSMALNSFIQEYLAQFVEDGSGVFVGVDECTYGLALAAPYYGPFIPPYRGQIAIGIDWGRYGDSTVLTAIDVLSRRVVDWERFTQIHFEEQLARVAAMYTRWAIAGAEITMLVEKNSIGIPLVEALQKAELPVVAWTATNATKAAVIESLQYAIQHHTIGFPMIEPLLLELRAYTTSKTPSGLIQYGAPEGIHDDCVISLALAFEGTKYTNPQDMAKDFTVETGNEDTTKKSLILESRLANYRAQVADDPTLIARLPLGLQLMLREAS